MSLFYSALCALGALLILVSITANLFIDRLIESTMISIANGTPIDTFLLEIVAVMSGGTLMIIPVWLQLSVGLTGCFIGWIGVQGLVLGKEGFSITTLFSRAFWSKPQKSFQYDPYE